jgi:hypothetical protein
MLIQKCTSNLHFIGHYENLLPLDMCNNLINLYEDLVKTDIEQIRGDIQFPEQELGRKDNSIFIHESHPEVTKIVNEYLQKAIDMYSSEYFTIQQFRILSTETKIQKTPIRGGYHVWHCEQSSKKYADRVLAWTMYLNDIPEGEGETEFLWQGIRIQPKAGTVSIFPAAFTHTHRGNPVYSKDKYIATGWFHIDE